MIRILVCFLALLLAGPAWAERTVSIFPEDHGFDAEALTRSVNSKLAWIERSTDYETDFIDYVEIRFVAPSTIRDMVGAEAGLAAQVGGIVFLRSDFRPRIDGAILLHELVHIAQFHNDAFTDYQDQRNACRRELEAYQLQTKWSRSNGGLIPGGLWMMMLVGCARGEF